MEYLDSILANFDGTHVNIVASELKRKGVNILNGSKVMSIDSDEGLTTVHIRKNKGDPHN